MAVPTSVKKKRLQRALRVQRQKKTEPEATVKVKTEEDVYLRYIRSMTCPVCGERIEEARMLKSHISTHLYLDIQKNVILVRDQSTRKPLDPLSGAVDLSVGKPNNEGQGEAGQAVLQFQNRMVSPCEFIYWCRMCDVSYMRKKELLRHKDEYHPGTDCLYDHKKSLILKSDRKRNSFVCEVCGASFICRSSMKHHAILHTKQDMYQCDVCSVNFANPFSLKKHKRVHAKDKADQNPPAGPPCICEVCGKLLSSKYQLEKHMQIHTRVTTGVTVHECSVCQLTFPNGNRLLRHKEEQHQTNKLVCEICGRTFGNSSGLKIHHYKVHFQQKKDVKPNRVGSRPARKKIVGEKVKFECDICGKCFSAKQTLTYHQGVHTGKGYECHICLRRFYHPSSLSTHVRIHAGEKPHECDVCHRKFLKLDTLQVHYRIHTGEKPFPCQVCGRRFRQSGDRRAHQRRHDARDSQVSTVATTTVPEVVLQEANMATQIISVVSWQ
ncbi:zinc finger protein OZF [Aplysia californica]|uniref:Zinc finger protein OZF n=1 Tax=Aplysia californica TaxID=6500 RepID=A0ABM0ZWM1_APLCA|nr:zinc finger protein OZF [Aplysia californica]